MSAASAGGSRTPPAPTPTPGIDRLQTPLTYVSCVSDISVVCCKCFIWMLQVDQDVAHVTSVSEVCCKRLFQMFHLFQTYVASVSFGCCKTRSGCCIYMQVFLVLSYVCCKCFIVMFVMATHVFSSFSWCFCKCFSYFGRMLQVFHLDIAKVDRVLHMLQCAWEAKGARAILARRLAARATSGWCGPAWVREMQA
jgi:hypothetical protein